MDLKKGRTVILIGFLIIVVVWMIAFGSRIADLNRLTDEYDQAQLTMSALTATTGALATEVVRAGSDAAVEPINTP
jgi:ABC-type amino acid transport system permease subunit